MRNRFIILGVLAVITVVVGLTSNNFMLDTLVLALIFATFATAWNIAGGMTGLFSLGHGGLFAVGAYAPVLLRQYLGVPTLVGVVIGALLAALAALLIGALSLRLKGHYFALATLAFTVIVTILLTNFGAVTGGDEGISLPFQVSPMDLLFEYKVTYLYLALGLYVITAICVIFLIDSRFGLRMRALREDEITARSMGVHALQTKIIAVVFSGFFTGLAGAVFAHFTLYITPGNTAAVPVSLQPALMAIIGGMLGVFGPFIGAILITFLEQQLITLIGTDIPGLSSAFFGGMLLISILFLPNGILSLFDIEPIRRLRNRLLRRSNNVAEDGISDEAEEDMTTEEVKR